MGVGDQVNIILVRETTFLIYWKAVPISPSIRSRWIPITSHTSSAWGGQRRQQTAAFFLYPSSASLTTLKHCWFCDQEKSVRLKILSAGFKHLKRPLRKDLMFGLIFEYKITTTIYYKISVACDAFSRCSWNTRLEASFWKWQHDFKRSPQILCGS